MENEADELAEESLIPGQLWKSHPARNTCKLEDVKDLASKADIHKSIVASLSDNPIQAKFQIRPILFK